MMKEILMSVPFISAFSITVLMLCIDFHVALPAVLVGWLVLLPLGVSLGLLFE